MNDLERMRSELIAAGVAGVSDLGLFVNDTIYLRASNFDEKAAMPVLLRLLPTFTDRTAIGIAAAHLARPWARPVGFGPLRDAFLAVAEIDPSTGWGLGDAMARTADKSCGPAVIELALDRRYGTSRQMLVYSLWRFKEDERVVPGLLIAIGDREVSLHAMSALCRAVGNEDALPALDQIAETHPDPLVRRQAKKAAKAARVSLDR